MNKKPNSHTVVKTKNWSGLVFFVRLKFSWSQFFDTSFKLKKIKFQNGAKTHLFIYV